MFVLPEIVLQQALAIGMQELKNNLNELDEIFAQYKVKELSSVYGQSYIDMIKTYISTTKIPVVQSWSFDAQKIPCISIHLGSESEDESKAFLSDFAGMDDGSEVLSGTANVTLDIGLHTDKNKDAVIWLYYMVCHILYKKKMMFHDLGLKLVTFSASDYNKESRYMTETIWTRWIRFKCTVQNYIEGQTGTLVEGIHLGIELDENGAPIEPFIGESDVTSMVNGVGFDRIDDVDNSEVVYYNQP